MKTLIVRMDYLDKRGAIIIGERLPVLLDNNPAKVIGTCRVFRSEQGRCLAKLELEDDVNEDLYFYFTSLNKDNGYWFTGLNLANNLYETDKIPTRLKEMII